MTDYTDREKWPDDVLLNQYAFEVAGYARNNLDRETSEVFPQIETEILRRMQHPIKEQS